MLSAPVRPGPLGFRRRQSNVEGRRVCLENVIEILRALIEREPTDDAPRRDDYTRLLVLHRGGRLTILT